MLFVVNLLYQRVGAIFMSIHQFVKLFCLNYQAYSPTLLVGKLSNLYYGGNIGYSIDEEYRGHYYAAKACLLLFELAKMHQLEYVIITCNPDNYASRKTCEYVGCELLEIVELPENNDMREAGETEKCIYKFIV